MMRLWLIVILFIPLLVTAQTRLHTITIKGKVTSLNKGALPMARVDITTGNKTVKYVITNYSGSYELTLEKGIVYTLVYSKHGFVSKRIEVSTEAIGDDELKYGLFALPLDIVLFEDFKGLDVSPLKEPVAKFSYSDYEGDFTYDEQYSAAMAKEVEKIIAAQKKMKKQAYDNSIKQADQLFEDEWNEDAILEYQNALSLMPDEKYPKSQIENIRAILLKQAGIDKTYSAHIRSGDKNFDKQNYKISKSYYQKSLIYKPLEQYPKDKISQIESLLAENPALYNKSEKDATDGEMISDNNNDDLNANNTSNNTGSTSGNNNNESNSVVNDNTYSKNSGINNVSAHSVSVDEKKTTEEKSEYLTNLLDKYTNSGDSTNVARVHIAMGIEAFNNGLYDEALENFRRSYDMFGMEGLYSDQAAVAESMADIYFSMYRYTTASDWYARSNSLYLKVGNNEKANSTILKSADASYQSGDLDQALSKYLQTLELSDKNSDLSSLYNTVGVIHFELNNMDEALKYYNMSITNAEAKGNTKEFSMSLNNIGNVRYEAHDYNMALQYYNRSIMAKNRIDYKAGIAVSLHNIANVFKKTGDYKKAIEYYIKSEKFAIASGNTDVIYENYGALAEIYSKTNDCAQAIKYYKLYADTKHLITRRQDTDQINESSPYYANLFEKGNELDVLRDEIQRQRLLARYEAAKKQKEIDYLNIQNQLNAQKLTNSQNQVRMQRFMIAGAGAGLLLLLLLLISLIRQNRQKKKANFLLAEQNEEIKSQKQEIESQRDMLYYQKGEIEHIHLELTDSIRYAKRIQEAVLSTIKSLTDNFEDSFIIYMPLDLVSGDFYWSIKQDNKLIFCVADCTGHGVPGAFMSMLGISFLNEIVQHEKQTQPDVILNYLRESTIQALGQKNISDDRYRSGRIRDGMDIALCALNLDTMELQFAGANSFLYLIRCNKSSLNNNVTDSGIQNENCKLIELKGDKMPIGVYERMDEFKMLTLQLEKGDSLYLLSDGYVDQFGGPGEKKFKREPLKKLLISMNDLPMKDQKVKLEKTHLDWKGKIQQIDDITILGIKI